MNSKKFVSVFYPPGSGGNFIFLKEKGFDLDETIIGKRLDVHPQVAQYFYKTYGMVNWNVKDSNSSILNHGPLHDVLSHNFFNTNLLKINKWHNHYKVLIQVEPKDVLLCSWLSFHKAHTTVNEYYLQCAKDEASFDHLRKKTFDRYSESEKMYRFMFNVRGIVPYIDCDPQLKFNKIYRFDEIWQKPTNDKFINLIRKKNQALLDECLPWVGERLEMFDRYNHFSQYKNFINYYHLALEHYG